uniref:enoyl-CoA hydratase/isomerase family protein n=1 Tax=Halosimplex salinum TaxID=1710538 RepID=UPI000F4AB085|nr:enoyl-CoA hydratase-related protein [Halosimplex salinum]
MDVVEFDSEHDSIACELNERGRLAITIDRPDSLNAIDDAVREGVVDLLERIDDERVRCVTFEGAGDEAFSAGADVESVADRTPAEAIDVTPLYEVVAEYPRPTLAAIRGYCLGGGHELALACDMRVATADAEFGFPEVGLGLLPGGGGTQRLVRLVGEARAKELVFRGHRIDAKRAADWGLINRAVPPAEFDETVDSYVEDLVSGPPLALKVAKNVLNNAEDTSLAAGIAMESQAFGFLTTTEDFEEGRRAFREGRDPEFEGK